ncbi:MAG TPA: 6-phosphogluconolactonase [Burkholderiales bacterium]
MAQLRRWHIYPSLADLERRAAAAILRAAAQAIVAHGRFAVVLAGGHTPRGVYARLADAEADWPKWHVYFGDERCRPAGHSERNDRMAREAWLDRVALPPQQIHAIPTELGAGEAARRYAETLARVETFDLVLLGLGEDGHTASLFPGRETGGADILAVQDAPKPPPERVSLGAARLSRARQVLFLVAGAEKRDAVAAWRRGEAIPASAIAPAAGVDILLDAAAWGEPHV